MPTSTARAGLGRAPHLGPERRRPQVLDAALEIALIAGIGAVTIGAVAQKIGVTRPVVYACYTDRVRLVEELLTREEQRLLESVLTALHASRDANGPEEAFVTGFSALLATVAEHPDAWRLLLTGQPDPALAERFRSARSVVTDAATTWIRPAMQRWWDTPDLDRKLPVLMELFISSCEAAVRSHLDHANDWPAAELAELYGMAVCRALQGA
ncbi:MAG: TetR/AcrR family transcriptional regulator [Pseudonocardiaceae bacterium]